MWRFENRFSIVVFMSLKSFFAIHLDVEFCTVTVLIDSRYKHFVAKTTQLDLIEQLRTKIRVIMRIFFLLFTLIAWCNCEMLSNVENAFKKHGIVPDSLDIAPNKIVNVSFFRISQKLKLFVNSKYFLRFHIQVELQLTWAMN